jgi:ferredoxin
VCRVRILEGRYRCLKMSRAHVSAADEDEGWVLACRVVPETDLVVSGPAARHPE